MTQKSFLVLLSIAITAACASAHVCRYRLRDVVPEKIKIYSPKMHWGFPENEPLTAKTFCSFNASATPHTRPPPPPPPPPPRDLQEDECQKRFMRVADSMPRVKRTWDPNGFPVYSEDVAPVQVFTEKDRYIGYFYASRRQGGSLAFWRSPVF